MAKYNSKWVFIDADGDEYTVKGIKKLAEAKTAAHDAGARGELTLVKVEGKNLMALFKGARK